MQRRILAAFLAGALTAAGTLQALAPEAVAQDHSRHQHATATPANAHPFIRDMERDMARMMQDMHAPGYTGHWDIDFLAMMIPHHQGAIDMAKLVLVHGGDPPTRNLAEEIIASQQVEIDAMSARLRVLRGTPGNAQPDDYPPLTGTRGTNR